MKLSAISATVAVISAMLFASTAAWAAAPLPPAVFAGAVSNTFGFGDSDNLSMNSNLPGSLHGTACSLAFGCATNTATAGGNIASVTASSSGGSASPNASVSYFFKLDGPANVPVPIDIVANLATTASDPSAAVAFAGIIMFVPGGFGEFLSMGGWGYEACSGDDCGGGQCLQNCSFPITSGLDLATTFTFSSAANSTTEIQLFASCAVFTAASCSATADPMITIDPGFLADHSGYSLEFSSGAINTLGSAPGVPEPATWAMLLAGFAGIGWTLRRRAPQSSRLA